jgi:putative SOS response-associated peptidase YedK
MCGRYALGKLQWWILQETFRLQQSALNLEPRWNIAPTQTAPIIRVDPDSEDGAMQMAMARWGLVPHFWNKPLTEMKYSTFNAKSETASITPSYRKSFQDRRCIIPAIGFYEWTGVKGQKQPWFINQKDRDWIAMAGLWDRVEIDGDTLDSFSILTTTPNQAMARIHTRMPVLLDPSDYEAWLSPETESVDSLLTACPSQDMVISEANKGVGRVKEEGEWLLQPGDGIHAGRLL